jgi:2-methylcitrate dehydratase PrpD
MMLETPRQPVTSQLLAKVLALQPDVGATKLIKHCVLDWLGVTLAGANDVSATLLYEELQDQGGHKQTSIIGRSSQLSTYQAALLNGTASHMLDYDDVNFAVLGHASAPVLASVLSIAEYRKASGAAVMDAFLTGYETSCRVGLLLAPGHYTRGFHATATIGSFGAAAACARLLGLDLPTAAHALGIAATRSAGLKSMFGTPCKPIHVGMAAATGVFSTNMASRGFKSRPDALEAPQGFAATHSPDYHPAAALNDPANELHLFENLFKLHCACYETQATIECGIELRGKNPALAGNIRSVRLRVNEHCNEICNIQEPITGMEAKFSLRAMAAFALSGVDTSRPDAFTDENANSKHLVNLRNKVVVDLTHDVSLTQTEMEVHLVDGSVLRSTYDSGIPIQDAALRNTRLTEKFYALAEPVIGSRRCEAVVAAVEQFESLNDVGELLSLVRQPAGA